MNKPNSISQELLETVERYVQGGMEPSEQLAFEEKLTTDSHFAQQVLEIQSLLTGIESAVLKKKMEVFHSEIVSNKHIPIKKLSNNNASLKKLAYLAAACMVILLGIFWFFNAQASNEKLFAKYYSPDPGLPTTMSITDEYDFYNGMVSYKQGHYDEALKKWEPLLREKPQNDTLNYFLGAAYLAQKNEGKAASFLQKVSNNPQSAFVNDAHFYLGLIYLKDGNIQKATENLQQSTVDKSKELLEELKRMK